MKGFRWIQRARREAAEAAEAEATAARQDALASKIEARVDHKAALDRDADVRKQSAKLTKINHDNHFSAKLTKIYQEGTA